MTNRHQRRAAAATAPKAVPPAPTMLLPENLSLTNFAKLVTQRRLLVLLVSRDIRRSPDPAAALAEWRDILVNERDLLTKVWAQSGISEAHRRAALDGITEVEETLTDVEAEVAHG